MRKFRQIKNNEKLLNKISHISLALIMPSLILARSMEIAKIFLWICLAMFFMMQILMLWDSCIDLLKGE